MVSYQKWTSVGYETARQKGHRLEGEGTQETNQRLVATLAEVWNDRKAELNTATVAEAREIAQQEIAPA